MASLNFSPKGSKFRWVFPSSPAAGPGSAPRPGTECADFLLRLGVGTLVGRNDVLEIRAENLPEGLFCGLDGGGGVGFHDDVFCLKIVIFCGMIL